MSTPVPLLALALALCGLILLVALIWHRRWLELAIVLLVGCAMALYFERGRRGPDQIGKLVAEVVNADRSISLHVQVEPGTAVWCSSVFSVEAAPAGEPARESADWFVDLHPTERSDAKPLNADAAGRAVVTLPARLVESAPNLAVRIRFNGNDQGTTRLTPHAESAEDESHAESAEKDSHAEAAEGAKSTNEVFDEVVGCVLDAVDKGQEPNLRLPPADEWGNPFSVTNGADFVKVGSFGADGKKSEDDFLLTIHWGEGFANVRRVSFDEELQCPSEEVDFYDW